MRRSMFAVLAFAICLGSAFADRKKTTNAPDTSPMPSEGNEVAQAAHRDSIPSTLHYPYLQRDHEEAAFPLPRELACAQETAPCPVNDRAVTKVYAVADLVVPLPCAGTCDAVNEVPKTLEAELIARIKKQVQPKSWKGAGGEGSLQYFTTGMALVVNQLPNVHAELERFLDAQRRLQDRQVTIEVRILTVSDDWFENSGVRRALLKDGEKTGENTPMKVLNQQILERLVRSASENSATSVLQTPRITCLSGQPARVKVCETEHFLTGLNISIVDGNVVAIPKNEPQELGISFSVEPTIADDGKTTRLTIDCNVRELTAKPVPLIPITLPVRSVKGSESKGEAVPFTQFMQEPKIISRSASGSPTVPDGGSVLMYAGKATFVDTVKQPMPALADIPALNELFTQERKEKRTNHLLVLVTSRVVNSEVLEAEQLKTVKYDPRLEKLMGEYSKACSQGNTNEARRLAVECLAIDPMCFAKP